MRGLCLGLALAGAPFKSMPISISGDATKTWRAAALGHAPQPRPFTAKEVSIEMRFDQIRDEAKGRVCAKKAADLTGTVMLDHGKPYIYVPELF
jgi:hypothetical protein